MPDRLLIRTQIEGANEASSQLRRLGQGVKDVGDDAKVAEAKFDGMMGMVRHGMRGVGGMVGGLGLASGIKDTVQAGMALQVQQSAIQQTLQRTGQAGKGAYAEIMDASEKLSTSGGFATEENLAGMNTFLHETNSVGMSMKALTAATDLARAKHESFSTALGTVRSALAGNYRAVRQLTSGFVPVTSAVDALDKSLHVNIASWDQQAAAMNKNAAGSGTAWLRQQEISHGVTEQMRQQAEEQDRLASGQKALGLITGQYSGQMAKFSQTAQGKADAMRAAYVNLESNIGEAFLPAVSKIMTALAGAAKWMDHNRWVAYALMGVVTALGVDALGNKLVKGAKDAAGAVKGLGSGAQWVARQLGLMTAAQEGEVASTTEAAAATDVATGQMVLFDAAVTEGAVATSALDVALGFLLTPILLVIAGVVALGVGIYELIKHWGAVEHAGVAAWHGIESALTSVVHKAESGGKLIAHFFVGAFNDIKHIGGSVLDWIINKFHTITHLVGSVGHFFGGIGHSVGNFFGGLYTGGTVIASHPAKHLYSGGPAGTDTVQGWLTPGEDVISRAGASTLNSLIGQAGLSTLNAGGNPFKNALGNIQINASPVTLTLNERVLAEGVVRYTLRRAARGPSSLVGGSLVTGV